MAGFFVTLTGGQVSEKSNVNLYVDGEHEHNSCAVDRPDRRVSAIAATYRIQEDVAIVCRVTFY